VRIPIFWAAEHSPNARERYPQVRRRALEDTRKRISEDRFWTYLHFVQVNAKVCL